MHLGAFCIFPQAEGIESAFTQITVIKVTRDRVFQKADQASIAGSNFRKLITA